jgi:hypothetical protein
VGPSAQHGGDAWSSVERIGDDAGTHHGGLDAAVGTSHCENGQMMVPGGNPGNILEVRHALCVPQLVTALVKSRIAPAKATRA